MGVLVLAPVASESRRKQDLFHEFDNLPLPQNCPVRTQIARLLIHATFEFDPDDYNVVALHLSGSKGLHTTEDLHMHFFFNREWWRWRVRMYTPRGGDHSKQLRRVLEFIEKEPTLSPWFEQVKAYLEGFAKRCEQGLHEELDDVELFCFDGTDAAGLNLWI